MSEPSGHNRMVNEEDFDYIVPNHFSSVGVFDPFRILITGSRDWKDKKIIEDALEEYLGAPNVTLVSGHCKRGADAFCEDYAEAVGWTIERHPADWELFGKQAGFIRNAEMVALGADICIAFILDQSRGATNCAALAQRAGIKTLIYN